MAMEMVKETTTRMTTITETTMMEATMRRTPPSDHRLDGQVYLLQTQALMIHRLSARSTEVLHHTRILY
jgi:hypothetical protein